MESGYNEIRELSQQALERERWRLRNDNQRLNGQINRLMNSFEREQLFVSEKIQERNEQIRQESMRALVAVAYFIGGYFWGIGLERLVKGRSFP